MTFVRIHFGWEGDGLPNSGPKQQAADPQGSFHSLGSPQWLRDLPTGESLGENEAHGRMRLCHLLAGPLVAPTCSETV